MSGALSARLADGRLHLQHGPIDLIIGIDGAEAARTRAAAAMRRRFASILDELVAELPTLRRDVHELDHRAGADGGAPLAGVVARRMLAGVQAAASADFLSPMAAVAGAVADEIADHGWAAAPLRRLYVNNGGDIAIRQRPGEATVVGAVDRLADGHLAGSLRVAGGSGIGGVATSGAGGRSLSLGIADAVTVLAVDAATADAAATVIANAVDLPGHPAIDRRPAEDVRGDTELGRRLVTCHVGTLSAAEVARALAAGSQVAEQLVARGAIVGAALLLRSRRVVVGDAPATIPSAHSRVSSSPAGTTRPAKSGCIAAAPTASQCHGSK